jgi:hypothetical protein
MLQTTDFKRFDPGVPGYLNDVEDMVYRAAGKKDCLVEVRVFKKVAGNRHKESAKAALRALVTEREEPVWEQDGYSFDFSKNNYRWGERNLYVTAGEALFLYRWLVMYSYGFTQEYYLRNLRKKFGKDFLSEVPYV